MGCRILASPLTSMFPGVEGMSLRKLDYRAFLLRLWQVGQEDSPVESKTRAWRASLESVDTGELRGFPSLEGLFEYLDQVCIPREPASLKQDQSELCPSHHISITREGSLYIQINTARISAGHTEDFVQALSAENLRPLLGDFKGYINIFLIQAEDDPQVFSSLSIWETLEDCQRFFSSPRYLALLGSVGEYLVESLDRRGFTVRVELSKYCLHTQPRLLCESPCSVQREPSGLTAREYLP